jgi:hypothetical protein
MKESHVRSTPVLLTAAIARALAVLVLAVLLAVAVSSSARATPAPEHLPGLMWDGQLP